RVAASFPVGSATTPLTSVHVLREEAVLLGRRQRAEAPGLVELALDLRQLTLGMGKRSNRHAVEACAGAAPAACGPDSHQEGGVGGLARRVPLDGHRSVRALHEPP